MGRVPTSARLAGAIDGDDGVRTRVRELAHYLVVYLVALGVSVRNALDQYGPAKPVSLLERPDVPFVYYPENDPALWLYSGVRFAEGRVPYRYLWDVKPPAIHETTALLALATGGNRVALYAASLCVALGSLFASLLLLTGIVTRLTGDRVAGVVAGLFPLAYWRVWATPATGLYPKYLTVTCGLLGVWWLVRDRYVGATVAASLAAWFWQPGIGVTVAVVAATRVEAPERFRHAITAVVATSAAVVAPIALGGGLVPMLGQVFVAPFVAPEGTSALDHLTSGVSMLGVPGTSLVATGAVGGVVAWRGGGTDNRVAAGVVVWFLAVALGLDLDGGMDLVPLAMFAALPAGLLVARVDGLLPARLTVGPRWVSPRAVLASGLVVAVVAALPWVTGDIATFTGTWSRGGTTMLYWTGDVADVCHLRYSTTERTWMDLVEASEHDRECWGRSPGDVKLLWRALTG